MPRAQVVTPSKGTGKKKKGAARIPDVDSPTGAFLTPANIARATGAGSTTGSIGSSAGTPPDSGTVSYNSGHVATNSPALVAEVAALKMRLESIDQQSSASSEPAQFKDDETLESVLRNIGALPHIPTPPLISYLPASTLCIRNPLNARLSHTRQQKGYHGQSGTVAQNFG